MRVALHYDGDAKRIQVFGVLLEREMRQRIRQQLGIELVDRGQQPVRAEGVDAVIAHQQFLTPEVLDLGVPLLMVERRDSSVLWEREIADHENVRAVWKIAKADLRTHKTRLLRPFTPWIDDIWVEQLPAIEEATWAKIYPQPAYLHYEQLGRWRPMLDRDLQPIASRVINVSYRGKVNYPQCPAVARHRARATGAVRDLPILCTTGSKLPRGDYDRELLRSRAVLSPYGYGELCYRDYEAVCAGCVLIKPPCFYIETQDGLIESENVFEVLPNFTNLGSVVQAMLADLDAAQAAVDAARSQLRTALRPESILASLTPALERLLA